MTSAAGGERANILLVDDKSERLLTYEAILESLGQNLVRATSGEEALLKLLETEFAAVLLDVNMPGMSGFETAALLRQHPVCGNTPIIFVTGVHISDLDRLKGYEMGAADYVYVPVVPEILRSKVRVLVQLHLQRRELAGLAERLKEANADLEAAHAELKAEKTRELKALNRTLELANAQLVSEVADRKRAEALLQEAARRKDEFIAILAHELRNPLAAMQSGLEILHRKPVSEGKLDWSRSLLHRQVKQLTRLIDDLLDVSRVTSGRVQLQCEPLELRPVLRDALDAVRPLLLARRQKLVFEYPPEPVYVYADPVRLAQVFGNLLTNAAKYGRDGGLVELVAETSRDGGSGSVSVRVRDDGSGIREAMLESIFELFAQAEAEDRKGHGGLGIGLALVRGLTELHGGSVCARSGGLGRGSEFELTLPLSDLRPSLSSAPERPSNAAAKPLRVLIVDDNIDWTRGLATYLAETSKHEVTVAHTGSHGLREAEGGDAEAVLLDVGLPDIDGYEVARRLRHRLGDRSPLVIGISGYGSSADRARAAAAGFARYFVKPVPYALVDEALAELAESKAPPADEISDA